MSDEGITPSAAATLGVSAAKSASCRVVFSAARAAAFPYDRVSDSLRRWLKGREQSKHKAREIKGSAWRRMLPRNAGGSLCDEATTTFLSAASQNCRRSRRVLAAIASATPKNGRPSITPLAAYLGVYGQALKTLAEQVKDAWHLCLPLLFSGAARGMGPFAARILVQFKLFRIDLSKSERGTFCVVDQFDTDRFLAGPSEHAQDVQRDSYFPRLVFAGAWAKRSELNGAIERVVHTWKYTPSMHLGGFTKHPEGLVFV